MEVVMALNILFLAFLGSIWARDSMFDLSLKFNCWVLALSNLFFVLKMSGYVVKVGH